MKQIYRNFEIWRTAKNSTDQRFLARQIGKTNKLDQNLYVEDPYSIEGIKKAIDNYHNSLIQRNFNAMCRKEDKLKHLRNMILVYEQRIIAIKKKLGE